MDQSRLSTGHASMILVSLPCHSPHTPARGQANAGQDDAARLPGLQFTDQVGNVGIAEQSSAIDYGNPTWSDPGSSYLLLGRQDAPVQLSLEQVGELVEYLERWLEHGRFVHHAPSEPRKG